MFGAYQCGLLLARQYEVTRAIGQCCYGVASAPISLYSLGKRADEAREMAPTSTKLIHQGDRNRVANKERSDIFHFIGAAPVMKSLDWHSYNSFCVLLSLKRFKLISAKLAVLLSISLLT